MKRKNKNYLVVVVIALLLGTISISLFRGPINFFAGLLLFFVAYRVYKNKQVQKLDKIIFGFWIFSIILTFLAYYWIIAKFSEYEEEYCKLKNFTVMKCMYNSTSKSLHLLLENTGSEDIYGFNVSIFYPNNVDEKILESLGVGYIKSYKIENVEPNFELISIKVSECPNIIVSNITC